MPIRKSSISGTPFGETAGRPANPSIGQTYYNGSLGYLEIYTSQGWFAATPVNPGIPLNVVATNVGSNRSYNNGSASVAFRSDEHTSELQSP